MHTHDDSSNGGYTLVEKNGIMYRHIGRSSNVRSYPASVIAYSDSVDVAIFKVAEDEFYATQTTCPHQHAPLLGTAFREKYIITCPLHGWQFDIRSGSHCPSSDIPKSSACLQTFHVIEESGELYLEHKDLEEPLWKRNLS